MHPFEIITILLAAGSLSSLLINQDRTSFLYLLFSSVVVLILQYSLEGIRWQLIPTVYLLLAMFIVYKIKRVNYFTGSTLSIWLAISALLPWAIPVFTLPEPGGEFPIGTETFHWVDSSRLEWFTDESDADVRELMIQVWYPGQEPKNSEPNSYMDHMKLRSKALASAGKIPTFFPSHLDMVKTNSHDQVDCSQKVLKYPVLIFSHGITGSRHLHQVLFEYLASRGYVVISPDHSYDSNLTIFPDGRIADYRSDITGHPDSVMVRAKQIKTRALDIGFVIDKVYELENGKIVSKLNGKLDLKKIALGGHSYGGATAVLGSHSYEEIKACFILDAWINPIPDTVIAGGIQVPLLFMGRPNWDDSDYPTNYDKLEDLIKNSKEETYHLKISETLHLDYTDIPLMSPVIKHVMDVGSLKPAISLPLINKLVHGFLEKHLMERGGKTLDRALDHALLTQL